MRSWRTELRPWGGTQSVLVYVAPSVAWMQGAIRRILRETDPDTNRLDAACYGVTSARHPDVAACVFLARPLLGAGYVAHELAHAGLRVLERRGERLKHGPRQGRTIMGRHAHVEERYAQVVGSLTAQFWAAWRPTVDVEDTNDGETDRTAAVAGGSTLV